MEFFHPNAGPPAPFSDPTNPLAYAAFLGPLLYNYFTQPTSGPSSTAGKMSLGRNMPSSYLTGLTGGLAQRAYDAYTRHSYPDPAPNATQTFGPQNASAAVPQSFVHSSTPFPHPSVVSQSSQPPIVINNKNVNTSRSRANARAHNIQSVTSHRFRFRRRRRSHVRRRRFPRSLRFKPKRRVRLRYYVVKMV